MMSPQHKFSFGTAVVTGAGAGIGMGISRRLAALGMHVVVTDIDEARAQAVVADIVSLDGSAEAMYVDVSQPAELDRLAEAVVARHGSVRVLVNNAGVETIGYCWELSAERWEKTLAINIHGIVHGCRAFIPRMLAHGEYAWIANLASTGAFGTMPQQTAYIMSKHAVQSFSECLYLELEQVGAPIHVASVLPGMVKTSIFEATAGSDDTVDGQSHRQVMFDMAMAHGMDLDECCAIIVDKIVDQRFWVDTQPEMTAASVDKRIAFLQSRAAPTIHAGAQAILERAREAGR